ncbi:MAG: hypothetical protein ACT4QC_24305 [Planctomycetaceae bacterium]
MRTAEPGVALTKNSIRLALAWYVTALVLMMHSGPIDWWATTSRGRITRWCWTWGLISFVVHLVMAFHFYHRWSHADAFERTKRISGLGEGLDVSYLFTWLWVLDVLRWWGNAARYAARSAKIEWALHGFMLFIVFNATVVFEHGVIRWAGVVGLTVLAVAWCVSRRLFERLRNVRRLPTSLVGSPRDSPSRGDAIQG